MKKKLKLLIPIVVVAAAAVVVLILKPWESKEAEEEVPELPEEYLVGTEPVPALTLEDPKGVQATQAKTVTYTYEGLTDSGAAASAYVSQLSSAEPRFFVVDETFMKTDRPDFSAEEGFVLLARVIVEEDSEEESDKEPEPEDEQEPEGESEAAAPLTPEEEPAVELDRLLTVAISWSKGVCVVVADETEGIITDPPEPEPEEPVQSMSLLEAVDYLSGLQPSALGLPGSSMDNYQVFALDGAVMVDGRPCMRLRIYELDEQGVVSEIAGSYFLSGNGQHLYQQDMETNAITELEGVLPG